VCNSVWHVSVSYSVRLSKDGANYQTLIVFWQDQWDANVLGVLRSFRCHYTRIYMIPASWQDAAKCLFTSQTVNQPIKKFPTFHASQFYYCAYKNPPLRTFPYSWTKINLKLKVSQIYIFLAILRIQKPSTSRCVMQCDMFPLVTVFVFQTMV